MRCCGRGLHLDLSWHWVVRVSWPSIWPLPQECLQHATQTQHISRLDAPNFLFGEYGWKWTRCWVVRLQLQQRHWATTSVNKTKQSCANYAKEVRPSGSSKRVSSSSRWKVGSLVPHTSFSAMIALESKVTHWPGPSWKRWNSLIDALTTLWMEVEEGAGTSLDCRMLRSGIHKVPTMVSQIRPLFHTSTVRPRSRRFISLHGEEMVD